MGKGFQKLIQQEKATILQKWFVLAIQVYDPDTAKFLKNQKDQFANPVGNNTLKGLQGLLDQLLDDLDPKTIIAYLDPIIRIRAVQAFTPSQATAFVLSLKTVIRETLGKNGLTLVKEKFAPKTMVDTIEQVYQGLTSER